MPFTPPTATELKARYPKFASVEDDRIAVMIADANRWVDDTWVEADYKPAIMALAAHNMVMEGDLDSAGAPSSLVTGPLRSRSFGDSSESYETKGAAAGAGGDDALLAQTTYGQQFLAIRRANHPGVLVV